MTPERRHRVEQIVEAALARPSEERRRFLEELCGGDAELLREVESLLGHDTFVESSMQPPALEATAADRRGALAGTRLGAYEVIRLLGAGGMGEVYLAKDTRLRRKVALKLLPPEFAHENERVRRFVQEARAASMLNHPNILTVFEIGQENDTRYIATELVDGVSLRERLARGPMSVREAVDVGVQFASALAAAHAAGIVHRDVKPENVMLRPDGYVKVLDFGLAKLTERSSASVDTASETISRLETAPGVVFGTVAYMSPEQLRAQELDAGTDIFSLGVVLYEMVAGRRPFQGETASDLMAATLKTEPAPLGQVAEGVPPELERIVGKALEKEREARYQRAEELLADLEELKRELEFAVKTQHAPRIRTATTMALGEVSPTTATASGQVAAARTAPVAQLGRRPVTVVLAALALAALSAVAYFTYFAAPSDAMTSIAVLPFANGSGDQELDYLSDGISESLINSLSHLPGVKVVARSSSFRYRDAVDPRDVAQALGVQGILGGRVEQRSGRLIVSVELVDARDNTHVWGERFDRRPEDLLAVQAEISREISDALRVRLSEGESERIARRDRVDPKAYELYLKGRHLMNTLSDDGIRSGLEYFQRATEVDPSFAPPFAGIAEAYTLIGDLSAVPAIPPEVAIPRAKAAASRAVELDDTLSSAHTSLARIAMIWELDWGRAEREFRRAIELNANDVSARHWYSHFLVAMGRFDESLAESERAIALDPLDPALSAHLGFHFIMAREYDRAIAQLERTLETSPSSEMALGLVGVAYEYAGRYDDAIATYQKGGARGGFDLSAFLGHTYAVSGRRAEAQKILGELLEESRTKYVSPYNIALIYAGLGEADEMFAWLEKAYGQRDSNIVNLAVAPEFDAFRSDPRFAALLGRVGLAAATSQT